MEVRLGSGLEKGPELGSELELGRRGALGLMQIRRLVLGLRVQLRPGLLGRYQGWGGDRGWCSR